ncbi:MAG: heat-inducible transcriptional repressor HrcA [Bacilli bacterium]
MLSNRQIEIFKAIVDEFILSAEPVGSKTLMEKYSLPYSSATIRNEMVELETRGLLEKTHTSSGRIPSVEGYRFYVEYLMERRVDDEFSLTVRSILEASNLSSEEVIKRTCDILSQMTNMTSIVLGQAANQQKLEHIKLFPIDNLSAVAVFITDSGHTENKVFRFNNSVSVNDIQACTDILNERLRGTYLHELVDKMEALRPLLKSVVKRHELLFNAFVEAFIRFANDNVYFSGQTNMMYQPDFADLERLKGLMAMMNNTKLLRDLGQGKAEVSLQTSDKSRLMWLDDLAIISSTLEIGEAQEAKLMLVGPSRMDYERILALVDYLTANIEQIIKEGESINDSKEE